MAGYPRFEGNCPRNVSKDAKYGIRTGTANGRRGPVVALVFNAPDDERWHATTDEHPELVGMVNRVKSSVGSPPNGVFYINEFMQVIVPTIASEEYYYAGQYETPLKFEFEGRILSGEAVDLDGNSLSPGDVWSGPHPGIPYILAATGVDIKYKTNPRPRVEKEIRLSTAIGSDRAAKVAEGIRAVKGFSGGRFYVNEFRNVFAPVWEGQEWRYLYIGNLDMENWFHAPDIRMASVP